MLHTHSDRLERWLGADQVGRISQSMANWYGPPIPLANVPGAVYAARGGDFVGPIRGGAFANARDFTEQHFRATMRRWSERQARQYNAGFASLSDLISEATTGKSRYFTFFKAGQTSVANTCSSLWRVGNQPAAGAAAAAAPGGTAPVDSDTGGFQFVNPSGGDTQHIVRMDCLASVGANTLLLYDRIFAVAKTMSSSGTEAVSGVPTRYQSTTATDADYCGGNFLFPEVGTGLSATAHNWTTCLYTDNDGNTGQTLPSVTGVSGAIAGRIDISAGQWFAPLATGDLGIKALTQMQCSSNAVTGTVDFVMGHPIAMIPIVTGGMSVVIDMINSAFNLVRIFDDACLAFLELNKPNTTATNYSGLFQTVAG